MATKKAEKKGPAVVVTTAHRGVFFGYLVGEPSKEKVMVTGLRNCLYWTQQERGYLGLIANGPGKGCRIGPSVPGESTLFDITGCYTCTPDAAEKWELGQWTA